MWGRDLEKVTTTEVGLFFARSGIRGLKAEAVDAFDRLQKALVLAAIDGSNLPKEAFHLIGMRLPLDRFVVDDFIDSLVKLSSTRRAAVLFALDTNEPPKHVAQLTWKEAGQLTQLPMRAQEVLRGRAKVRHLKLPYVFWEWAGERIACPLLQLAADTEAKFGMPWGDLQQRYTGMLWVSSRADAASFMTLADEVAAGRLS